MMQKYQDCDLIPHITMSDEELNDKIEVVKKGSKHFRYYSDLLLGLRKRQEFRKRFFKGEFHDQVDEQHIIEMKAIRDIEYPIYCHFSKLCFSLAKRVSTNSSNVFDDLYQEAILTLQNAMYSYDQQKNSSFFTFCYQAIKRTLFRFSKQTSRPIMPRCEQVRKLLQVYENIVENANDKISFDEVVDRAGWTEKQAKVVSKSLLRVVSASDLLNPSKDKEDKVFEKVLAQTDRVESEMNLKDLSVIFHECVSVAGLTDLQSDILNTYIWEGEYGWKQKVAKNRNITRQNLTPAFKKSIEKIRIAYQKIKLNSTLLDD
jgi:RNA polymerase sigma factor (sigma-70 family)